MSRTMVVTTVAVLIAMMALPTASAWNAGANGTAAVGASLFNKVFTDVIPVLEKVGSSIEIPSLHAKHYSMGAFHLSNFNISDVAVTFATPNQLHLSVTGFSIEVPPTDFSVFDHIFDKNTPVTANPADWKISCSGHFSGGTSGASVSINVALATDATGNLTGVATNSGFSIGNLNVDFKMHNLFCKLGDDIIKLFKHAVLDLIEKEVDKIIPGKLNGVFQSLLDRELPRLPLKFVSQPKVVADHMEFDISLLKPFNGAAPTSVPARTVQPHIFTDRDISIGLSAPSFDDFLFGLTSEGIFNIHHECGHTNTSIFKALIPAAYAACPDCRLDLDFHVFPSTSPTVVLGRDSMGVDIRHALINFTAHPVAGDVTALFSVDLDLQMGVTNFSVTTEGEGATSLIKLDFSLGNFSLTLASSAVGSVDVSILGDLIGGLMRSVILPTFNKVLQDGIPLDLTADGFGIDEWKFDLNQDAISLGANLLLPVGSEMKAMPSQPQDQFAPELIPRMHRLNKL